MAGDRDTIARKRAEVIMAVRSGRITATEGAKQLGVSRKTYYQWENRFLEAALLAVSDRKDGRPSIPADPEKEALREQVKELQDQLILTETRMTIRELLHGTDGSSNNPDKKKRK
jgi:transposase